MKKQLAVFAVALGVALGLAWASLAQTVIQIDIKPFSDPNSINSRSKKGVVPVAICTGATVVNSVSIDNDADPNGYSGATTNIDVATLSFAYTANGTPLGAVTAMPKHDLSDPLVLGEHMTEFVDTGDRAGEGTDPDTLVLLDAPNCNGAPMGPDLVVHFPQPDTGLAVGDLEACLTATLTDSTQVIGCDSVRIVK